MDKEIENAIDTGGSEYACKCFKVRCFRVRVFRVSGKGFRMFCCGFWVVC